MRDRCPIFFVGAAGLTVFVLLEGALAAVALGANEAVASEGRAGLLYAITHLHPAIYVILFVVFLASVANLILQGQGLPHSGSDFGLVKRFGRPRRGLPGTSFFRERGESSQISSASTAPDGMGSGVKKSVESQDQAGVGVRHLGRVGEDPTAPVTPTPLDGVNHPLPEFSPSNRPRTATQVTPGTPTAEPAPAPEFKFSSAVDMVTSEEMERREKEQLTVSGTVIGPDGKGIESVIVYLADEDGNRVGQLCRSLPETGEFKVLAAEPGRYVLHGYKRGFVMEDDQVRPLPLHSGKIEGYVLRLVPEGCLVAGQVILEGREMQIPAYTLTCICKNQESPLSGQTDADGRFKITGVPLNTQCLLEIRNADGLLVSRSAPFHTTQKREIHLDLTIGTPIDSPTHEASLPDLAAAGHEEKSPEASVASGHAPGSSAPSR